MASRARTARRAGRARHNRIDRDFARTGDAARAQYAHAVASGPGLPSLFPSNWDQVISPVQRWRTIYRHLAARRSLWKQVLADECNRFVTVDGVRIDLHAAVKVAEKIESLESDERERALDFYAKCSSDLTPEWIQKVDD